MLIFEEVFDTDDGTVYTLSTGWTYETGMPITGGHRLNLEGTSFLLLSSPLASVHGMTINGELRLQVEARDTHRDITMLGPVRILRAGTHNFSNCTLVDVLNPSGAEITLNLTNGSNISGTVEDGITILFPVGVSVAAVDDRNMPIENAIVYMTATNAVGTINAGDVILSGLTNSSGIVEDAAFSYELAFNPSGLEVDIRVRQGSLSPFKQQFETRGIYNECWVKQYCPHCRRMSNDGYY